MLFCVFSKQERLDYGRFRYDFKTLGLQLLLDVLWTTTEGLLLNTLFGYQEVGHIFSICACVAGAPLLAVIRFTVELVNTSVHLAEVPRGEKHFNSCHWRKSLRTVFVQSETAGTGGRVRDTFHACRYTCVCQLRFQIILCQPCLEM